MALIFLLFENIESRITMINQKRAVTKCKSTFRYSPYLLAYLANPLIVRYVFNAFSVLYLFLLVGAIPFSLHHE